MDEKSWTWAWFFAYTFPFIPWVTTWSCTSWSLWLSLPQLEHYRTIVWTNNIQLIYIFYMATRKGRSYSWVEGKKKENTKSQLIGIMSRWTIRKHSELISETKCTSDCQCLYKKCNLLWKPFGGNNQKAYSQQYHYWLTDDVTISSLPIVAGIVFIKRKTANNKYVVSFYKQHLFIILIIFTFLWFANAWDFATGKSTQT